HRPERALVEDALLLDGPHRDADVIDRLDRVHVSLPSRRWSNTLPGPGGFPGTRGGGPAPPTPGVAPAGLPERSAPSGPLRGARPGSAPSGRARRPVPRPRRRPAAPPAARGPCPRRPPRTGSGR